MRLENNNVTPSNPMVFDAYGNGVRPLFRVNLGGASAIDFGTYNNTDNDGGYTLRNVIIESTELTGFHIAIHSQTRAHHGVTNVVIRNNSISSNSGMGILGQFSDSVIECNLFESNNYVSGSGFDHGTYLSGNADGGRNLVLRNNRYIRNSVVNGTCLGGNMTFHGQMDGVLIEGNTIEQEAAARGCWAMSITQGYNTAEWFRNFVVRNNWIINAGNTACYPTPANGSSVVRVTAPNSQVSNNLTMTGAAASSGVCAR